MAWAARIERLLPDLSAAILRFPVPASCSVLLCIWLNAQGWDGDREGRVVAAFVAAFMASGAVHLNAEARGISRTASLLLALGAATVFWLVGYLGPVVGANSLFLLFGLLPVLMIAPALRAGAEQGAIWLFNLRLGLAALIAFIVALLFALGLSAITGALEVLFGLRVGPAHEHIWFTASTLVGPLYGLSLMPRKLNEAVDISPQRGSLLDRGISVLVNYVAVPVIAAYALILHAYAIKILIEGELPEGQVGTMVSIFAIGGTATWLVAWPWREAGTRLLRLFMFTWFFLLVIPGVLLSIAIWRRIADYGVTPDRYGVALVAVWVAALVLYLALRRNRADMRVILGAAAVLLLVGSAGPWSANSLTVTSQFARLVTLLEANGVLEDGKITLKSLLPYDAASSGNSILEALNNAGGLEALRPWFPDLDEAFWSDRSWAISTKLGERLGFQQPYNAETAVSFSANTAGSIAVPAGGVFHGPFDARQYTGAESNLPMNAASYFGTDLIIRLPDSVHSIPQQDVIAAVRTAQASGAGTQVPLRLELGSSTVLLADQVFGNSGTTAQLTGGRFWLILPPPP